MQNLTNSILLMVILTSFFVSCSRDGDSCAEVINSGVVPFQEELSLYEKASANYVADPNPDTCQDFVVAGRIYIAALKEYRDCLSANETAQYDTNLSTAEQSLDSVDCN